jgi:hypothetical protein
VTPAAFSEDLKMKDSTTPFDDYTEPERNNPAGRRTLHLKPIHAALRVLSALSFGLAISSACVVIALDCLHFFNQELLPWRLKSAFPLIFVGISYGCLQFTLPRTWKELVLSLSVCMAFILWGSEQFVSNAVIASRIDDGVMFLFVLDLSIVIGGYLKQKRL